jgi:hypothetical protein
MDSIYLGDAPNPFNLPTPSAGWLKPIHEYDALLRILPSQTQPVYRLMRVAKRTGAANAKLWSDKGVSMCADTIAAFQRKLVAITTLPAAVLSAPPEHVVQWLKDHDLSRHGGADAVCDRLEAGERAKEQKIDDDTRDEGRQRHKAAYVGYQYRTGARVSLVRRIQRHVAAVFHKTPDSAAPPVAGPASETPASPSVAL